jgi:hypothetical protein
MARIFSLMSTCRQPGQIHEHDLCLQQQMQNICDQCHGSWHAVLLLGPNRHLHAHVVGWRAEPWLNLPEPDIDVIDILALSKVIVVVADIYVWQW